MRTLTLSTDAADQSLQAARRRLAEPARREAVAPVLGAAALAAASALALAAAVILGPPGQEHPASPAAESGAGGRLGVGVVAPSPHRFGAHIDLAQPVARLGH